MGVDVHEKRRLLGQLDHNPACGHVHVGNAGYASRMIVQWRKRKRRKYYYDYKKTTGR